MNIFSSLSEQARTRPSAGVDSMLNEAFAAGDCEAVMALLGPMLRAKGVSRIARKTSIDRVTLYRAFALDSNPKLKMLCAVLEVLGLRLAVLPIAGAFEGPAPGATMPAADFSIPDFQDEPMQTFPARSPVSS